MNDEFFSLPLFPQQTNPNASTIQPMATNCMTNCGTIAGGGYCPTCTCSNCGTTCGASNSSLCPRCGCAMTAN